MSKIITLLTDFGLRDPYVGVVKGVVAGIAPVARLIDISHDVAPQDLRQGGFLWAQAVPYFPEGSIHVAVVDPGVGSERRIVAARSSHGVFLAPDNGILGSVLKAEDIREAVSVESRRYFLEPVSRTFHGRDIFAPVAARLARGLALGRLGPAVDDLVLRTPPRPSITKESGKPGCRRYSGQIEDIDRFGNCISNVQPQETEEVLQVRVGRRRLTGLRVSYSEVASGKPLALINAGGYVEIAVREGRADTALGLRRGQNVIVLVKKSRRRKS